MYAMSFMIALLLPKLLVHAPVDGSRLVYHVDYQTLLYVVANVG